MKYQLKDGSTIEIEWDTPGWDWEKNDYSWLSSQTHIAESGFFIHGGKIRHQRSIPNGYYSLQEFFATVARLAVGLEDAKVVWLNDTGEGSAGVWVEGTRPPTTEDAEALAESRKRRDHEDKRDFDAILSRHPDWG